MKRVTEFISRYNRVAKFLVVGVSASIAHGAISWMFYYHIWGGFTILSTLMGYTGGWLVSYLGNRMWSFRWQSREITVVASVGRFIFCQFVSMGILLSSTWIVQMLIMLYFWWYIITNHLTHTPELVRFSEGASYPPALLVGMFLAAIASYLMMRKYVFSHKDHA